MKKTKKKNEFDHTSIKTFEDACEKLGLEPNLEVSISDKKDEAAYKKLKIISKALNQEWTPDYNNRNQLKWYPWFKWSGSGFSFTDTFYDFTNSYVGSRLCYATSELAEYAGKQFSSIYNDFLI